MNGLDLVLVLLAVVAAVGGWRLGFLHRLSGWIGAGMGLALAIVTLPTVVERLGLDSDTTIFLVCTAVLVLFASIGQAMRQEVDTPAARTVDAVGGALLGILGVGVIAWLVVPVMADTAGWAAASARGSIISRLVDEHLPDPPPQIAALERQLAGGQYPQLFTGLRQAPDTPPPPTGSTVGPELLDRAARSVVRIQGEACDRIQSGSGFVVQQGVVVTNAHVVAGTDELTLETPDGASARGVVVTFDPATDLALVATDLQRDPLPVSAPVVGDRGLVLGFPGGGDFAPSPFEVAERLDATGYDIYDSQLVERDLLALSSQLEPGDSGSAVLRDDGSVIGVAVAVAPDQPLVAYALDAGELESLGADADGNRVDTGPCIR